MLYNLGNTNSLITQFVAELRDSEIQKDRMRFRRNMERIGEILGYELSKKLPYKIREVQTSLGSAPCAVLAERPVLATILRAGLALHQGLLSYFDGGDNAFISAYRKHRPDGSFDIKLDYCSCPSLVDRILIVSDPMLATGSSMVLTLQELFAEGRPKQTHIVCAIACVQGIEKVRAALPDVTIWTAAVDEGLNDKSFIVPGLGDAGDLAFGEKVQA